MRLPLVPTAMVALAVPALVALGFWQLDRREEKRAELAAFVHPARVTLACDRPQGPVIEAGGLGPGGAVGFAHRYVCAGVTVDLGWSERPLSVALPPPGPVTGTRFQMPGRGSLLLVAAPPPPLSPSTPPSADDIPNNHLSYAVQWFAFALTLAIVYAVYVARRLRPAPRRSARA